MGTKKVQPANLKLDDDDCDTFVNSIANLKRPERWIEALLCRYSKLQGALTSTIHSGERIPLPLCLRRRRRRKVELLFVFRPRHCIIWLPDKNAEGVVVFCRDGWDPLSICTNSPFKRVAGMDGRQTGNMRIWDRQAEAGGAYTCDAQTNSLFSLSDVIFPTSITSSA